MKKQAKLKVVVLSLFLMLSTSLLISGAAQRSCHSQGTVTNNYILEMRVTRTFTVSPLSWSSWYLTSQLTVNGILQYSWTVIGGGQSTLQDFYIVDSANLAKLQAGQGLYCYNRISGVGSKSGSLTIPHTDYWYLIFDMQTSLWNSVTVQATMTYTAPYTPPTTPPIDWELLGGLIVFLLIVAAIAIAFYAVRSHLKSRSRSIPATPSVQPISVISTPVQSIQQPLLQKRFCIFCGNELEQDAIFCIRCGKQQRN